MKIAIFDIQPCEKELFDKKFKKSELKYSDKTINKANLKQFQDAEVISVFVYSKVDAKTINKFPNLKLIVVRSTGFDHVDLKACKQKKITVCNVPSYGANTVAEYAFALLLSISRKTNQTCLQISKKNYNIKELRGFDLHGKTIGIIGAGKIGKNAIKIAKGFGMEILAYDIYKDNLLAEILDFKYSSLKNLLKKSDIISIHCPYNKKTHHVINKKNIKSIKKGAVLINTSRGGLLETAALIEALDKGIISFAGLDVLEDENLIIKDKATAEQKRSTIYKQNKKLLSKSNVVFTPHNAFNTDEAIDRITGTTIDNIKYFYKKETQNTIK